MYSIAIGLNLLASLASAAWGVVALANPSALSNSGRADAGEIFYARMYAARTIPLGLAAAIFPFLAAGPIVAWLLVLAATIQFADIGVGLAKRQVKMVCGASLGAAVHLACAYVIGRGL